MKRKSSTRTSDSSMIIKLKHSHITLIKCNQNKPLQVINQHTIISHIIGECSKYQSE